MRTNRARVAFLGILGLFILPLVLAWLMLRGVFVTGPTSTDNAGHLVTPPRALDWSGAEVVPPAAGGPALSAAWVLLYPVPASCGEPCLRRVRDLHQVQRATGRNADRLRIAILPEGEPSPELGRVLAELPEKPYLLSAPSAGFRSALQRAGEGIAQPSVYLVDPLGNIMMIYESGDSMTLLLRDLEKLLKWSRQESQSPDRQP